MSSSPSEKAGQTRTPERSLGDDDDNDNKDRKPAAALTPREKQRQRALEEAQQVLDQVDSSRLDAFHLLGVVADPRGPAASSSSVSNSYHGRYTPANNDTTHSSASAPAATSKDTASTSIFGAGVAGSYYQQWESTLSQMTGQMEALNWMLEDWSRYLVEEGDVEPDLPPSQLRELPPELAHLDTSGVDQFLAKSGQLATVFYQILAEHNESDLEKNNRLLLLSDVAGDDETAGGVDEAKELVDVSGIPDIFFDPTFDLTHPATFCQLLLDADSSSTIDLLTTNTNTTGPVHEWFPLLPQDALALHLDKVELALLQQVRSHSGQFFAESQRFALLQEWIDGMLVDVTRLQRVTDHNVVADLLRPLQTVPVADAQRADLRKLDLVLERAEDMLLCKHGLGGVLAAAAHDDDLLAIEQISYGRRLLEGRVEGDDEVYETEESPFRVELGRLHAFKTIAGQLNQYEQLVVSNLRDELVEIFLSWNSAATSAAYGAAPISTTGQPFQHHQPPDNVRTRVTEIASALRRCRALGTTKEAFGTRLQDVTRMTVRTVVGEFAADNLAPNGAVQSVAMSTSSMTLPTFMDCLDMLFEQLQGMLTAAANVDKFLVAENLSLRDGDIQNGGVTQELSVGATTDGSYTAVAETPLSSVLVSTAELMSKSISELLRIRKDAHALILLDEMKSIWDVCTSFANELEQLSGGTGITSALRSTLLAQVKAFVERKHESNMAGLAAALDSERWVQCEVSGERQEALNRLCSGRSVITPRRGTMPETATTSDLGLVQKTQEIEAEGTRYKVVWSCLLLVEMILNNIGTAAHFSSLSSSLVGKISELLRLFNSRTTQLVLGAGAIHSHAKLKSINAKHLSLVTQCLGMIIAILPHIRAALMAQLPKKQHTLLTGLDQIRKEYGEHNDKVLNKFVSIIGGIIEHGLAKKIPETDFDQRAQTVQAVDGVVHCCVFLEGVSTNTKKMHQVLYTLLPPDHLKDTFSRIFAFIDTKVPALFLAAANIQPLFQKQSPNSPTKSPTKASQPTFVFPITDDGKRQFLLEVEAMTKNLNSLEGVHPWDFTVTNVLERRLEYSLASGPMALAEAQNTNTIEDSAGDEEPVQEETGEAPMEQPVIDSDNENAQVVSDEKAANGETGSEVGDSIEAEPVLGNKDSTYDAALPTAAVSEPSNESEKAAEFAFSTGDSAEERQERQKPPDELLTNGEQASTEVLEKMA